MDDDDQGGFISGIFNYCDRWCERCTLTARCRVFATEQGGPPVREMSVEEVVQHLHGIFAKTIEMAEEAAQEMGVDLDAVEDAPAGRHPWDELEHDDLLQAARRYGMAAHAWLDSAAPALAEDDDARLDQAAPAGVDDAVEIIAWYHLQILAKLTRAMSGLVEVAEGDRGAQLDCDGSAKVALIGIDRSLTAWTFLASRSSDLLTRQQVVALIDDLVQLRTAVEARFPSARSFVRPGFDRPLPEKLN